MRLTALAAARSLLPLVVAATTIVVPLAATSHATGSASVHGGYTATMRAAMDGRRRAVGRDALFPRGTYVNQAAEMARRVAEGVPVTQPADGSPASWVGAAATAADLDHAIRSSIAQVVDALDAVLRYDLHTDGGWAVAILNTGTGYSYYGVVGIVGWPDAPVGTDTGCSTNGYCWTARGLNPHLPWTRNQLRVHLSTYAMPADGEYLVRSAIARINAVSGLGVDVVYGGRTSATGTNGRNRFLVRWSSTGCSSTSLACTITETHGSHQFVVGGRIIVMSGRYRANPNRESWIGTLTHELGHALGLGHYDALYNGGYQMMRWAGGPNHPRGGDVNGLRALDRPGRVSIAVRSMPSQVGTHEQAYVTVRAASNGLGGIRSVAVECTDTRGVVRTMVRRTGVYDVVTRDHGLSWTVGASPAYWAQCRAVATSKASRGYSAWQWVLLGG